MFPPRTGGPPFFPRALQRYHSQDFSSAVRGSASAGSLFGRNDFSPTASAHCPLAAHPKLMQQGTPYDTRVTVV
jgi:hypothetical protein